MHISPSTLLAALLASRAAALAVPRDEEVTIGGSDADGNDATDLIAAYEQVEDIIPGPVAAPVGTGTATYPEDSEAISDAAADDATHGGLSKRGIFERGTCKTQPSKFTSGPSVASLNRAQWESQTYWRSTALKAATPNGYFQVANWRALLASAEASPYRGYTSDLTFYDVDKCAARCNSINGCSSFVIYFERNPTVNLDKTKCPTSDAQTLVKCAFYGVPLVSSQATNDGQFTGGAQTNEPSGDAFYTSIAGSNAYTIVPPTPEGFNPPVPFGVATIKNPQGTNTYMGIQTFPDVSFNPQVCADACNAKSAYNQREAARKGLSDYRKCRFFNAYVAYKNDAGPLFTCTYYIQSYGPEYATNIDQYNKDGDHFTHGSSYGFSLHE